MTFTEVYKTDCPGAKQEQRCPGAAPAGQEQRCQGAEVQRSPRGAEVVQSRWCSTDAECRGAARAEVQVQVQVQVHVHVQVQVPGTRYQVPY